MKPFYFKFGSGKASNFTGLSPTLTIFYDRIGLTSLQGPTISEIPAGSGVYSFLYGPTLSLLMEMDGGAALPAANRYIYGALDPVQAVDDKLGYNTDSFGSTSVDPSTVFGYLKRGLEINEGDATFNKSSSIWTMLSRGSSTLLRSKALSNTTTSATKTGL